MMFDGEILASFGQKIIIQAERRRTGSAVAYTTVMQQSGFESGPHKDHCLFLGGSTWLVTVKKIHTVLKVLKGKKLLHDIIRWSPEKLTIDKQQFAPWPFWISYLRTTLSECPPLLIHTGRITFPPCSIPKNVGTVWPRKREQQMFAVILILGACCQFAMCALS